MRYSRAPRPTTRFIAATQRAAAGLALAFSLTVPGGVRAQGSDAEADLARLLDVQVEGASRYAQSTLDAPAVVRLFQGSDAALLGHETVGDILQRLPGVYLATNRTYTSFGLRGFDRAGDFNSRTLMTIDGLRVNDAIFDQATPGSEFPIPADWVKRAEFVYGPAASVYGGNALLGVANLVTLDGADAPGAAGRVTLGSFGQKRVQARYGYSDPGAVDLFIGALSYRDRGEDLSMPSLADAQAPDGVARGLDGTRTQSAMGKLRAGAWHAKLIASQRDKDVATAEYGTTFGAPGTHYIDRYGFGELGWDDSVGAGLRASARLATSSYAYLGRYRSNADAPDELINVDDLRSRTVEGEAQLQWHGATNHVLVAGAEWRFAHAHLLNHDLSPAATYLDRDVDSSRVGLFLQDQWRVSERWSVTLGARVDHRAIGGTEASPRLAVVYRPSATDAWKLSAGRAFREPNIAERYYEDGVSQAANPSLGAERIGTVELGWDHALASGVRTGVSLYRYDLRDMIDFVVPDNSEIGQYHNLSHALTEGVDVDIESAPESGWRWRASATLVHAVINGQPATNSPRWLLKGHLLAPFAPRWWAGLEGNAVGRREGAVDAGAYALINAVLRYEATPRSSVSLRATNLGDSAAHDVATPGMPMDLAPRPRRAFMLDWTAAF